MQNYIGCDDGYVYCPEDGLIQGKGFSIWLSDSDENDPDLLWVENYGNANDIIEPNSLPIDDATLVTQEKDRSIYEIAWTGGAFPRNLLPQESKPVDVTEPEFRIVTGI